MPRPRFARLAPEKRDRIIDAAGQEFAAHGYERASLNSIIDEAGISKGAFYYYFDDKADLFATVLQHVRQAIFESEGEPDFADLDVDTFWNSVDELTRRSLDYNERHPWVPRLSRTLHQRPDEFGAPLQEFIAASQRVTVRYIERGLELGLIRDDVPRDLLVAMVSALDQAVDAWFSVAWETMSSADAQRLSRAIVSMFRGMVEPREVTE